MSKENKISKTLKDHEKRIYALEALIGKSRKSKIKAGKQSLSDHIIELRDIGFFSQPKIAGETHTKLTKKYHCELNRVAVALVRLAGRKQLRKASKIVSGKKHKAYVW
ncbi:hypothetical protein KKC91_06840 [bacterium]|nr:hypothetical protein [bacterium]